MNTPVKTLLLLLAVLPSVIQAEDEKELPDISLLEFLGSFDEKDSVWLDMEIDETKLAQAKIKQEAKDHE